MSAHCHHDHHAPPPGPGQHAQYRRILWIALLINAAMFLVEMGAGLHTQSVSLLADAIDFLSDSANYGISLWVLHATLTRRAYAAMFKGVTMAALGLAVGGRVVWGLWHGVPPEPYTMGAVGLLALVANLAVAVWLYAWRDGDANMRSVWLCTRNDAMGNIAVMAAAAGVWGTSTMWPDLAVAALMAGLAVTGGISVVRQARQEISKPPHTDHAPH